MRHKLCRSFHTLDALASRPVACFYSSRLGTYVCVCWGSLINDKLEPLRRDLIDSWTQIQAIIWTNAALLLIAPIETKAIE